MRKKFVFVVLKFYDYVYSCQIQSSFKNLFDWHNRVLGICLFGSLILLI